MPISPKLKKIAYFAVLLLIISLAACDKHPINNPQQLSAYGQNIRFGSFGESPKTLDPAQAYSADETLFISQIYEPVLQYHYLKRPYQLIPLTAKTMPVVRYWNAQGQELAANAPDIAFTSYDITIKPGIYYQPHPAFAKDAQGNFLFLKVANGKIKRLKELTELGFSAKRELTAEDYIYEIKRLAHPTINSPILGLMEEHIVGLKDYVKTLRLAYDQFKSQPKNQAVFFDLRKYALPGVSLVDKYTYRVTLIGQYPQFQYWLATWFFSPLPWEADYFYSQLQQQNSMLSLNWYPVGTGAYMLTENNPNKQMVLTRNPNFHPEFYPKEGTVNDRLAGYLQNAGKRLPLVDKFVFSLEKESIPRWNKFLQGYYDQSAIASDNFNEAIQVDAQGKLRLTSPMKAKQIQLTTDIEPSIYYYGFNMEDPVVGGYSESARKLRQAIAIAINIEDFIHIFLNDRGLAAQGPLPPGIFGYAGKQDINQYVYDKTGRRKSLAVARQLLAEAGYPEGRSNKTGKALLIRFDTTSTSPSDKDQFDWLSKQLAQLGIELNVESTDYNRFQEKLQRGDVQFYSMGWMADYPDPENFLFQFYGPNSTSKQQGVNYTNYNNPDYDRLFQQMKNMPNNLQRQQIIQKMIAILQADNVWVWGVFPKIFYLSQSWLMPIKPNSIALNILKYQSIIPAQRYALIQQWNQPLVWPLLILLLVMVLVMIPAIIAYWLKTHRPARRQSQFTE